MNDNYLFQIGTEKDITNLLTWHNEMAHDVHRQNTDMGHVLLGRQSGPNIARLDNILQIDSQPNVQYMDNSVEEFSEVALTSVDPSLLKPDQLRAYEIVTWHLDQTLCGRAPPPLHMLIHGEGGTGKSKVIQTISDYFSAKGAKHWLLKAAYTGVAASLIDGKTTHSIAMISRGDNTSMREETKEKLQNSWKYYRYLIIDEMSMISKTFLAKLSHNITIAKLVEGQRPSTHSFGGINVIMCGDFHQFPPVAVGATEALYFPSHGQRDAVESQIGRCIYEEFNTVVLLKDQMRVHDPEWLDFLRHLRLGQVQEHHIEMLRSLILTNPKCDVPNFDAAPWSDVSLVTPQHGVRRAWNVFALQKHAQRSRTATIRCTAEDTIKGQPLSLSERYAMALHMSTSRDANRRVLQQLPNEMDIALGRAFVSNV